MKLEGCRLGKHKDCKREMQKLYFDEKTGKPVYKDEFIYCKCDKRGCECFVNAAERKKVERKRKS